MNVFPFYEAAARAEAIVNSDPFAKVFMQFNCAKCGTKQTIPDANKFYKKGQCEECNHITDCEADGINYLVTYSYPAKKEN